MVTAWQQLHTDCALSNKYPTNLTGHDSYEHVREEYLNHLDKRANTLFSDETNARLDIWELPPQNIGWKSFTAMNVNSLRAHLNLDAGNKQADPKTRYVFVHGRNSRSRLHTSRDMLMLIFTYHQVMPSFLDFLFPLGTSLSGEQERVRDMYFSGFRHELQLSPLKPRDTRLKIDELGRSGRQYEYCICLKSVESSPTQTEWPWSVRHAALHHCFDVGSGHQTWVVVKGNDSMKNLIGSIRKDQRNESNNTNSVADAFGASFETILLFCSWASENWRWYLNFLDERLQAVTELVPVVHIDRTVKVKSDVPFHRRNRSLTADLRGNLGQENIRRQRDNRQHLEQNLTVNRHERRQAYEKFSFQDLQDVQIIGEKASGVQLVLKTNMAIVADVRRFYTDLMQHPDLPDGLAMQCKPEWDRFERRLLAVEDELRIQHTRAGALLEILASRRELMFGILEYNNVQASNELAVRSQGSAEEVRKLTSSMHDIARKTEEETMSMKVITVVTLFYLPATFVSTFMSSDIIRWEEDQTLTGLRVKTGAVYFFLSLTLPLMTCTTGAWYAWFWWKASRRRALTVTLSESRGWVKGE